MKLRSPIDFQKTTREYNGKKATAYVPRIKKDTPVTRKINDASSRIVSDYLNKKVGAPSSKKSGKKNMMSQPAKK
jgi:hypothetical protein